MTNILNGITVSLQAAQSNDAATIQLRAFRLNAEGQVSSPADFIYPTNNNITIDLCSVPGKVTKIIFTITTQRSFGETTATVQMVGIGIPKHEEFLYDLNDSADSCALTFGEVIRSTDGWMWHPVAEESNITLDEIARRYNCNVLSIDAEEKCSKNEKLINNTYNLISQIPTRIPISGFELWTVDYHFEHENSERENGLLFLANQKTLSYDSEALLDCWKKWLGSGLHRGTVTNPNTYKNWLFVYIDVSDEPANGENDPLLCILHILQSVDALQKKGLSCERLEDWMFTDHGQFIPNHLLRPVSNQYNLSQIVGKYLQERYPNLSQPWSGLLQRLTDGSLDIKLLLKNDIWDRKHESAFVRSENFIQRQRKGTDYVLEWSRDKTILILRDDANRLSQFQANTVYVQNDVTEFVDKYKATGCSEISTGKGSATIKGEGTETITILPFLVSKPLLQCMEPITLGGPEDVISVSATLQDKSKLLILDIGWPLDIPGVFIIIRNDCYAKNANDFCRQVHYVERKVKGRGTLVECDLKSHFSNKLFSNKIFVSVFSYQFGQNGFVYSTIGQHRECVLPSCRKHDGT